MDWTAAAALVALVKKVVDTLRYASARDVNGVSTQLVSWAAGVGVFLLAAHTAWAPQLLVGGISLDRLNVWSLVFVGLTAGSASSLVHDTVKAVDNADSAKVPTLLPRSRTPRS
jgi:hypothetical protein